MEHKQFLAGLPQDEAAQLTTRRNAPGLWHLAGHLGLILGTGLWIALKAPLWFLILPVQGIALVFLFTLEHEATHRTPFASNTLNEWVGRACGLILVLPFEWFRYFHLAHHRYTNIPGKDPELAGGQEHLNRWGPFVWHVTGLPYWGSMMRQLWSNARGAALPDYIPPRALPRIQREALVMMAVYVLLVMSLMVSSLLFWVWILPVLLGQPFLRLYLMAEHGRCPKVADMFDNTRTTYTNRIMRFLAWNMPYHTEHHVWPSVPFHQLPALNAKMQAHLKHEQNGYARFTADTIGRY